MEIFNYDGFIGKILIRLYQNISYFKLKINFFIYIKTFFWVKKEIF